MNTQTGFAPQWASPPGETIADFLVARGWTPTELATRLEESTTAVEQLLSGAMPITVGLARRLNQVIGSSVSFWLARDLQYREDLQRIQAMTTAWTDALPTAQMIEWGWVDAHAGNDFKSLLDFFAVPSVPAWNQQYSGIFESVAFRTSASFEPDYGATVSWLRQGERLAAHIECEPWDPDRLLATLRSVRKLTRVGKPQRFVPKLRSSLAKCGVAVAIVRPPEGCRASGAAVWLSSTKALVILSARHLADDHFWFTFYHECGHLLLHGDRELFIDEEYSDLATLTAPRADGDQESEANSFVIEELLTREIEKALQRVELSYEAVLRLSARAGIAPGILVGQLQKSGRLGHDRLNKLKRRYRWAGGNLVSRENV